MAFSEGHVATFIYLLYIFNVAVSLQHTISPPQSSTPLSTLILNFFLPKQNVPDYTPIGHTPAPIWRLFGACYLFAVETPRGSMQRIRDCCSVNSPLTSSGWAWLLFKRVSFVLALNSNLCMTDSPGGRFNGITIRCTLRWVVTLDLSEPEGGTVSMPSD